MMSDSPAVERVGAAAYTVPTEQPESDGTLSWDATTLTVVEVHGGGRTGTGYSYGHRAVADIVADTLAGVVVGRDASAVGGSWSAMIHAVRNVGQPGVAAMAVSAVDIALWDLKARLLGVPLFVAIDPVREKVPIYGSGGFTSYSDEDLAAQLGDWVSAGIPRVKMKVGRDPDADERRLDAARKAVGPGTALYVDANGAYQRKQALRWAQRFADAGVTWLEEPVSSDDLEGLRQLRENGPAGVDIAAGEYGFTLPYFAHMLGAGAVDCLQADVTRCGGITAFLRVGGLCDAHGVDLSAHCAPLVSTHACTAIWHFRHLEYFHDHVRIEGMLFDGVPSPRDGGFLVPDRSSPGLGVEFKRTDAERYRVG
jgi:L-alanine-DL-glutamate epimerase-like enolase superfamily enzyme